MKLFRMFGLAVVLILAATAFIGVGSASATALCKENKTPCPKTQVYSATEIEAKLEASTTALLHTDVTDVECEESEWEGEWQVTSLGEFLSGEMTNLTFAGTPTCETTPGATPCTVTALGLPYQMEPTSNGGGNGALGFFDGGEGAPRVEVICAGILECTIIFQAMPMAVTGGNPATANATLAKPEWEGELCPKKLAELSAEYEISGPKPLFIAAEVAPPVLCSVNSVPCPGVSTYGIGTTIEAEPTANFKFIYTYSGKTKEPTCTGLEMTGKTTETGKLLIGEISSLKFAGCGGGVCAVNAERLPYKLEIEDTGGGSGTMVWRNQSKGQPAIYINCNGLLEECIYGVSELSFTVTGGAPAKFTLAKVTLAKESGSSLFCGATATWEGAGGGSSGYEFTAPNPLYVSS